jgi:hypothetical protein
MRESTIDKVVCTYARERGLTVIKLSTVGRMGTAGWPDRMFLGPDKLIFFIEFKRPGAVSTPLQKRKQAELRALGLHVYVCADRRDGIMIVTTELNGRSSARAGAIDAQAYERTVLKQYPEVKPHD